MTGNDRSSKISILNYKSNQIELIASTTSLTSSITSELFPKVDSSNDLLNGGDFRNNKLINKEKQDWIQNYLDDNDKKQQEEELNGGIKSNKEIVISNNEDDDVGTSVDDIELKEDLIKKREEEEEEENKKDFNDFIKIDNLISGNVSSNR